MDRSVAWSGDGNNVGSQAHGEAEAAMADRLLHLKTKGGGWLFDVSEAAAGEHNSGSFSSKPGEIQKQGLRTWF
jgi:hypothetical protein